MPLFHLSLASALIDGLIRGAFTVDNNAMVFFASPAYYHLCTALSNCVFCGTPWSHGPCTVDHMKWPAPSPRSCAGNPACPSPSCLTSAASRHHGNVVCKQNNVEIQYSQLL